MEKVGELKFYGHYLDIYRDLGNPLFLAGDVARMIDYSVGNTSHMLKMVDESEMIFASTRNNGATARGNATMKWFLTEDGLYEVLFQSRKPVARRFKFTIKQVLKKIRRDKELGIDGWFQELSRLEIMADEQGYFDLLEDLRPETKTERYFSQQEKIREALPSFREYVGFLTDLTAMTEKDFDEITLRPGEVLVAVLVASSIDRIIRLTSFEQLQEWVHKDYVIGAAQDTEVTEAVGKLLKGRK